MTKYILYCAQDANFQTRSMLCPYDAMMACPARALDFAILREECSRDVKIDCQGQIYTVDQLLIQNYVDSDHTSSGYRSNQEESRYSKITNNLTFYADSWEPEMGAKPEDQEWISGMIQNVASSGFNHVTNYCMTRNATQYKGQNIDIVEGFLVLQARNGKLDIPLVSTVQELFTLLHCQSNK